MSTTLNTPLDENFTADAYHDEMSELAQMADERGFDTIEEMLEYDREQSLLISDYMNSQGVF